MSQQHASPLSPDEQRAAERRIREAVVRTFPGRTRPSCRRLRGYIDRVTCGRVVPGLDALRVTVVAARAGRPRDEGLALLRTLLAIGETAWPADEPEPDALTAAAADAVADGAADVATLRAAVEGTPEAYEHAAEMREQQGHVALCAARAFRTAARQTSTTRRRVPA